MRGERPDPLDVLLAALKAHFVDLRGRTLHVARIPRMMALTTLCADLVFLPLAVALAVANILTFGNGNVLAAVLQQSFVQQAHVLTNDQLLHAFSLGRVTPGQANLYVASIGYRMFGFRARC